MEIIKLYENFQFEEAYSNKITERKKLPITSVKDFLFFFNISLEDFPKLMQFSEELEKEKQFILKHKTKFDSLTFKEKQVFKLVVNGKKSNEIAQKLFVETTTISTHRKHIKQKLNLESIFDWYRYAKAFKLIEF
ncbi:regulatory protein, luxR family [Polaribacter sp. KT25b]|uniref:helix-turn-helix domain-containing protein n=1 Tax=Polaribacter sp. KT25b TaxID=1855336 RepID=UPI00087CECCA|nr:helix-turn-helix transcriptional regulator [Polaribacter sp. KT25b]SDR89887.1 regulatory protein, luxR family [Polaribacter sp. KT25b]